MHREDMAAGVGDASRVLFAKECFEIKAACLAVHEELGCGFLEKVYENALAQELRSRGLRAEQQRTFEVQYNGHQVGHYVADLVVQDSIIVEVKAIERDCPESKAQLINYLKASGLSLGVLVNFGRPYFTFERFIFTKDKGKQQSSSGFDGAGQIAP